MAGEDVGMMDSFFAEHTVDPNGNPSGGRTWGKGFEINWQNGPLAVDGVRHEPNGAFVETVIAAARDRINFYQAANGGKFACRQNALAITKLEEALHWLNDRTAERERRGVEGTHTA